MLEGGLVATVSGLPALSVADATVAEAPGARLAFAVTLDRAPQAAVTVDYATQRRDQRREGRHDDRTEQDANREVGMDPGAERRAGDECGFGTGANAGDLDRTDGRIPVFRRRRAHRLGDQQRHTRTRRRTHRRSPGYRAKVFPSVSDRPGVPSGPAPTRRNRDKNGTRRARTDIRVTEDTDEAGQRDPRLAVPTRSPRRGAARHRVHNRERTRWSVSIRPRPEARCGRGEDPAR